MNMKIIHKTIGEIRVDNSTTFTTDRKVKIVKKDGEKKFLEVDGRSYSCVPYCGGGTYLSHYSGEIVTPLFDEPVRPILPHWGDVSSKMLHAEVRDRFDSSGYNKGVDVEKAAALFDQKLFG